VRDSQRSSITCLKVFLESEEGLAVVTFGTHASGVLGQYHPHERMGSGEVALASSLFFIPFAYANGTDFSSVRTPPACSVSTIRMSG